MWGKQPNIIYILFFEILFNAKNPNFALEQVYFFSLKVLDDPKKFLTFLSFKNKLTFFEKCNILDKNQLMKS